MSVPPENEERHEDTTRADPDEILRRLKDSVKRQSSADRYTVVEEIARGGMGVILRVHDEELRRSLAMKVLRAPDGDDRHPDSSMESQRSARFLEEAQVTGQLDHPGIPPVHEMGIDPEDRLYFTMRLVKGRTLSDVIDAVHAGEGSSGSWTLTRALGVIQKVCEAMGFAHERGVIHRDLKPSNIMVGRFGETYVMDWGLAKILGQSETKDVRPAELHTQTILSSARTDESGRSGDSPLTTMDGDVIGTPAYMSPEQARGKLDEIGPWSDVYSVGALLYHLLAGTAPYVDKGARTPVLKVLQGVYDGPPQSVAGLAPDVPSELVAICEKAMARDPEQRYAGMLAMADDIQAFIENRVVSAYETGAAAEFRKWVHRNRGLAASLAAAALLLFAGLAAVSFVQTRAAGVLAAKNEELETTNDALDLARTAAEENEELALANAAEARWQSYAANVVAANASLELGAAQDAGARLELCDPEHRGWEWRFLRNRIDASLMTVEASPESFVYGVAYSPDGDYVATSTGNYGDTGGEDFTVRIWEADTGALVHELEGHTSSIFFLDFSPSGTELASGSEDNTVRVWDVETGELLTMRQGAGSKLAYHPDGLHIAIGISSGQLILWNSLEDSVSFRGRVDQGVRSLAISEDGERIAAGGPDYQVRVWDIERGALVREVALRPELLGRRYNDWWQGVVDLEFGPDGGLFAALEDGDVRLIDVDTGQLGLPFQGHEAAVTGVVVSPDGKTVVTSSLDATIRFWSRETRELLEVLQGHDGPVNTIARSADGDRIISGSNDRTLRFWDGQPGSAVSTFLASRTQTKNIINYDAVFSPDGTRLAWQPTSSNVTVSDTRTGEDLFTLPTFASTLLCVAFDASGEKLYTVGAGDHIRIWDARTGVLLEVVGEPLPPASRGAFRPDGAHFAAFAAGGSVSVWDARTSEKLYGWPAPMGVTIEVEYSPDGRYLAGGFRSGIVLVWNTETYGLEQEVKLPYPAALVRWTPDGKQLVANTYDSWDDALYFIDVESGEIVRTLTGHAQPASVAVSPDGTRIVTGNWDRTVSLWDVERGEVVSLRGHDDIVATVAFGPAGKRIVSAAFDGRYRLWDTTTVSEREKLRRDAARRHALERRARPIVDGLFMQLILKEDVVARLEADASLSEDLRATAVRLTRCRSVEPIPGQKDPFGSPAARAYGILLQGDRTPDEYLRALRAIEHTVELVPNALESPLGSILGLAQFRMGRVDLALKSMQTAWVFEQQESPTLQRTLSPTPVVIAICLAKKGRRDEARKLLDERRRLVRSVPDGSLNDPMTRLMKTSTVFLLAEAERILDGE